MTSLLSINSSSLTDSEIQNIWASKRSTEIEYVPPKYQKGRVISCYGNRFIPELISEPLFKSNLVSPLAIEFTPNKLDLLETIGSLINPFSCELKNNNCVELGI